jgi:hypothetical protein
MIFHFNCTELASMIAPFAAITTNTTVITDQYSFVCSTAHQTNRQIGRLHLNHIFGANLNAFPAALAFFMIHDSISLDLIHVYRIKWTGSHTGSEAEAGVFAGLVTVIYKHCSHAILNSAVCEFGFTVLLIPLAHNLRNHFNLAFLNLLTHDLRDLRGTITATDRTGADRCFP